MSSTFPISFDSFTDPVSTGKLNSPSHSQQHININDAVEKIEAKIGITSSAVTTTHDYKLSGVTGTDKAMSLTGTETATNKTFTSPTITTPTITTPAITGGTLSKPTVTGSIQTVVTDTDAATITFDLDEGNTHQVTLTANRILAISNEDAGQYFAIEIIQGGSGSYTVTWFDTIKWVGGTEPTLTTTVGKKDTFMFRVTGSDTYDGYIVGMNI
jgi:hypothetical protein